MFRIFFKISYIRKNPSRLVSWLSKILHQYVQIRLAIYNHQIIALNNSTNHIILFEHFYFHIYCSLKFYLCPSPFFQNLVCCCIGFNNILKFFVLFATVFTIGTSCVITNDLIAATCNVIHLLFNLGYSLALATFFS